MRKYTEDEKFMKEAIKQAKKAASLMASFIYFSSTLLMTAMICVAFPALSLSYFNLFWKTFSKNSRHIS